MCGRFTLRAPASLIAEQFGLFETPSFKARYNIAPTQPVAAVRVAESSSARELAWLRWGLVPSWAKDIEIGNRMINARAETVAEKPAYRGAFRRRRCLIVADGFYEWKKEGKAKQPYHIQMADGRPFAFAGLWEVWEGAGEGPLETCCLLTGEPNALMKPIHDRMPVILAPDAYEAWLDPAGDDPRQLQELLRPYPAEAMVARAVSRVVNDPRHEGPDCIEPITAA